MRCTPPNAVCISRACVEVRRSVRFCFEKTCLPSAASTSSVTSSSSTPASAEASSSFPKSHNCSCARKHSRRGLPVTIGKALVYSRIRALAARKESQRCSVNRSKCTRCNPCTAVRAAFTALAITNKSPCVVITCKEEYQSAFPTVCRDIQQIPVLPLTVRDKPQTTAYADAVSRHRVGRSLGSQPPTYSK